MVDSGNTWRSAISADLCRRLRIPLDRLLPLPGCKLSTAEKGANLEVLGELPSMASLEVVGLTKRFPFRPIVVNHLAMEANLSGPWLKRHGWDQIHSEDAIRIDGQLVSLRAGQPCGRKSHAYIKKAALAKANSLTLITLRAPDHGRPRQGTCYLRGDERFMEKTLSLIHI